MEHLTGSLDSFQVFPSEVPKAEIEPMPCNGLYRMARPPGAINDDRSSMRGERSGPMGIVVLGIDLGKNVCSIVGLDGEGRVVVRRRMTRARDRVRQRTSVLHDGDGGVLRRPSSWSVAGRARA